MKRATCLLTIASLMAGTMTFAAQAPEEKASSKVPARTAVAASTKAPDGIQFTVDGGTHRVQLLKEDVVRVTFTAAADLPPIKNLSVVGTPSAMRFRLRPLPIA